MTLPSSNLRVVTGTPEEAQASWTQAQQDVHRFATRPEEYAAQECNAGVRESNRLRVAGEPGLAWMVFFRSFKRQRKILGLSYVGITGHEYLDEGPGALS